MLGIVDLLLPKYLQYIRDRINNNDVRQQRREELKIIGKLSIAMKTLINVSEILTRTFVEPKHDSSSVNPTHKSARTSSRSASIIADEDSMK
jgi:hypothetical protein